MFVLVLLWKASVNWSCFSGKPITPYIIMAVIDNIHWAHY